MKACLSHASVISCWDTNASVNGRMERKNRDICHSSETMAVPVTTSSRQCLLLISAVWDSGPLFPRLFLGEMTFPEMVPMVALRRQHRIESLLLPSAAVAQPSAWSTGWVWVSCEFCAVKRQHSGVKKSRRYSASDVVVLLSLSGPSASPLPLSGEFWWHFAQLCWVAWHSIHLPHCLGYLGCIRMWEVKVEAPVCI